MPAAAAAGYAGVPFCEGDLVDAHRKRGCDGHAALLLVGMAAGFRGRRAHPVAAGRHQQGLPGGNADGIASVTRILSRVRYVYGIGDMIVGRLTEDEAPCDRCPVIAIKSHSDRLSILV